MAELATGTTLCLSFHPKNGNLITCSDRGLYRWPIERHGHNDGSQLAAACGHEGIRVWDLRRVRERLATMNLDWVMAPYPPAVKVADAFPLQVEVDLGPFASADHRKRGLDHSQSSQ